MASKKLGFTLGSTSVRGHFVGMTVYPNGELHVLVDNADIGTPWSNLPTDKPLYAVVGMELHGTQIEVFGKDFI